MKVVIIAAGRGSRLNFEQSKPLTSLLGLSLIERVILSAKKVGVREFLIVTGYKAELLKKNLGNGGKFGVTIQYVYNSSWRRENGISVLKAEEIVGKENFLLLMADHIFEAEMLEVLCRRTLGKNECILCVDRNLEITDVEDATKVVARDGIIQDIGKNLQVYNGIDCGAFLCSPAIFQAIRTALSQEKDTLTEGVKILCGENRVKSENVTGSLWIDIDTPENLCTAEKMLQESLKRKSHGPISKTVNKRISLPISKYLCRFKINPNVISVFCFFLGIVSGTLLILQNFILAGLLAQTTSVLDDVDDEIAQLTLKESGFRKFFNSILDKYADAFIILGMTYAVYMNRGELWVWFAGCMALIGSITLMLIKEKYQAITGHTYLPEHDKRPRFIPATRDVRLFVVMLGGILDQVLIALVVIALITIIQAYLCLIDVREIISEKVDWNLEEQPRFLPSGK
jgi:choline kinase/phosphatidylglycerophosphate synthase